MSRELDKPRHRNMQQRRATEVIDAVPPTSPLTSQLSRMDGFVTFRYSSTEVFSQDGKMHVKMKQARYQDGRLTSEECEGTVDRQAYDRIVSEAQQQFIGHMFGFAKLLLMPFLARGRRNDE